MNRIAARLKDLREKMIQHGFDAYIVYSQDPHGSEYVADYWRSRAWISGFTGSAGIFVLTREKAGLWTDSRYYIQAEQELTGSGITLFRSGIPGVPEYRDWLCDNLLPGSTIGTDGRTLSVREWESLHAKFIACRFSIANKLDLIGNIWTDRPSLPSEPIWLLDEKEAGESRAHKIKRVREVMAKDGYDFYLLSSLDDIAWLLNVRGGDVPYNPVVQSYLILSEQKVCWYVDQAKLTQELHSILEKDSIHIRPYTQVTDDVSALSSEGVFFFNAARTNSLLAGAVPEGMKIMQAQDITTRLKAQKNPTEQENLRLVMEKDGTALVHFMIWLEKEIQKKPVTELEAAAYLRECRSRQDGFLDESFSPIPAYRAHGAICHYEAENASQFTMEAAGLFLLDSGGQYRQGTTDVTRTIALGKPTPRERKDYTLVLKGHIALSRARFPLGTRGYQLDILARQFLWKEGLNYGHGTGHGVGYILNVHEGPQRISPHPVDEPLQPGMVTSNEPGLYREGQHGIRIENLILTVPWDACPEKDEFFCFETLTLCPYDKKLIDSSLLNREEIAWLNSYHQEVMERLSPLLDDSTRSWLKEAACEIS